MLPQFPESGFCHAEDSPLREFSNARCAACGHLLVLLIESVANRPAHEAAEQHGCREGDLLENEMRET